jgi:ELWxxDGT repeat protein
MLSLRFAVTLVIAVALPATLPAVPHLVKDLNREPSNEFAWVYPDSGGLGQGLSYFGASDPAHGIELWRTDGTPAGTRRLTDACAGRCHSLPQVVRVEAGRVFFTADDGFSGRELWVSDGTPGSERRVRDLCPGPCSSSPQTLQPAGEDLLFFALIGPRLQLWRTDGTREGTTRIKLLCPSGCDGYPGLISIGDRVLFFLPKNGNLDLWVSDGTPAGTQPFAEVAGGGVPQGIQSVTPGDGFAWMWTTDGLWRTDGTAAGTYRLAPLSELATSPDSVHSDWEAVWHGLYFNMLSQGEMIRSDGTPAGTYRIAEIPSGGGVSGLLALEDEILLIVFDQSHPALWSSRGTAGTTGPAVDLGDLEAAFYSTSFIASLGNRAVFRLTPEDTFTPELWITDGTTAGTRKLGLQLGADQDVLFPAGDRVFFLRQNDYFADDLWISDWTEAGTHRVHDFRAAPGASGPLAQIAVGGRLLFSAQTSFVEAPLFLSDGTARGTRIVSRRGSWADDLTRLGDRVFFTSFRREEQSPQFPGVRFQGLWRTDATPVGTSQVSPGVLGFLSPMVFAGQLFFGSVLELSIFALPDLELFKSDGTPEGTGLLENVDPYNVNTGFHHTCVGESSYPVPAALLRGRLFFVADDGVHGRELWSTDGNRKGTRFFFDVNPLRSPDVPSHCEDDPGPGRPDTGLSSDPGGFVPYGRSALFSADDGTAGRELWRTDGTTQGTHRVADLRPGPGGSAPHDLVVFRNLVYFLASTPGAGEALWRTDGTARGTALVRDLTLRGLPSWGRSLTVAGDRLFFSVYNETTGAELWASRGDAATTGLVADLYPGPGSSAPQAMLAVDGALVFAADDGVTGLEPWRSNGTATGTFSLGDLAPGLDASSPGPFDRVGDVVITGADDGVHGREPWAIPLADLRPR